MDQFVKKRQEYFTLQKKGTLTADAKKPTLEEFLRAFSQEIKSVNESYKNSKQQFEADMKAFKEQSDLELGILPADK